MSQTIRPILSPCTNLSRSVVLTTLFTGLEVALVTIMLNIKRLVIVALTSALTIATAQVASASDESCANSEPSQAMLYAIGKAQDAEDNFKGDDPLEGAGAEVSVYLHVIRRAPQGEGDIPVARAREITIDAMNRAYAEQGTPFRFKLAKIDYTNADDATYHLAQYSDQEKKLWDDLQVRGTSPVGLSS
jgi:hypothetical protein